MKFKFATIIFFLGLGLTAQAQIFSDRVQSEKYKYALLRLKKIVKRQYSVRENGILKAVQLPHSIVKHLLYMIKKDLVMLEDFLR